MNALNVILYLQIDSKVQVKTIKKNKVTDVWHSHIFESSFIWKSGCLFMNSFQESKGITLCDQ